VTVPDSDQQADADGGAEPPVPAAGLPWFVKLLVVLAAVAVAFVVAVDLLHFVELF